MDPPKTTNAVEAFAILSSVITSTSIAVLAIAEETVAEVAVLMKNHMEYIDNQSDNNHRRNRRHHVPDHRQFPRKKRRKLASREASTLHNEGLLRSRSSTCVHPDQHVEPSKSRDGIHNRKTVEP